MKNKKKKFSIRNVVIQLFGRKQMGAHKILLVH